MQATIRLLSQPTLRARAALARVLACEPGLIVGDEPVSALNEAFTASEYGKSW